MQTYSSGATSREKEKWQTMSRNVAAISFCFSGSPTNDPNCCRCQRPRSTGFLTLCFGKQISSSGMPGYDRLAGCFLSFNFSQKNEKDRNCQRSFEADMGDVHTVMRSPWDLFPEISFPTIAPDLIDRHASSFVARPQLRTTKWRSMGGLWPHIQFPLSRIPFFFSFSAVQRQRGTYTVKETFVIANEAAFQVFHYKHFGQLPFRIRKRRTLRSCERSVLPAYFVKLWSANRITEHTRSNCNLGITVPARYELVFGNPYWQHPRYGASTWTKISL